MSMTPAVINRALSAIEMRRRVPQPTWREIAAELGVKHHHLIEAVDRWYAQRDRMMDVARQIADHELRRERAWRLTEGSAAAVTLPEGRAPLIAELVRQLELEARELGLIARGQDAPAGFTINNVTGASANAVSVQSGTAADLRAFVAAVTGGAVPLSPMDGNGNGCGASDGGNGSASVESPTGA